MPITYREAGPADAGPLLDLLRLMHAENGLAPMSEAKVMARIHDLLQRGKIILAERGGAIVGSVGLVAESWWYSDAEHVTDNWIFVHPDHRGATVTFKLLRAAKAIAKSMGMPLYIGLVGAKDLERKTRLFSRDMSIRGVLFVKEP